MNHEPVTFDTRARLQQAQERHEEIALLLATQEVHGQPESAFSELIS